MPVRRVKISEYAGCEEKALRDISKLAFLSVGWKIKNAGIRNQNRNTWNGRNSRSE